MANPKWIDIRLKTEPSHMKHVRNRIFAYKDQVVEKYFFQFLQYLAATGADIGRNYIASSAVSTDTGRREGRQGRIKTGEMQRNFKWRVNKEGKRYNVDIGWVDGEPGYSIFQEQGVTGGVVGMNAIGYVTDWVRQEMKFYEGYRKGMRINKNARLNIRDNGGQTGRFKD